jgi:hypothetical protein
MQKGQTLDEIVRDLTKYGFPTFEQFNKNPEKWLGRDDDALASVDVGSHNLRKIAKKYKFEIEGYRCKSLEEIQRVANSLGIKDKDLDYKPELIPLGGGDCEILVKFVSKQERQRRDKW